MMDGNRKFHGSLSVMLIALVSAALACSLSTTQDDTPDQPGTATTTYTAIPVGTFALPTATFKPTVIPTRIPASVTPIPCVPYTNWPVYMVRANDTLSDIAARTGTTVGQLVIANCLADSDMIFEGQQLYVPFVPPTATPLPTETPFATIDPQGPRLTQELTVRQHWIEASTGRAVTYQPTVRVDAGEVYNADRVEFYVDDPGGGAAVFIGVDADPWDGAFVDYDFPAPGAYTFVAFAENDSRRERSNVFTVTYDPGFIPPEGLWNVLNVNPHVWFSGAEYRLSAGTLVTITWPNAPVGAYQVDFLLTERGQFPLPIGSDRDMLNGASTTWEVPDNLTGFVQAHAQMPDGSVITSQEMAVVSQP